MFVLFIFLWFVKVRCEWHRVGFWTVCNFVWFTKFRFHYDVPFWKLPQCMVKIKWRHRNSFLLLYVLDTLAFRSKLITQPYRFQLNQFIICYLKTVLIISSSLVIVFNFNANWVTPLKYMTTVFYIFQPRVRFITIFISGSEISSAMSRLSVSQLIKLSSIYRFMFTQFPPCVRKCLLKKSKSWFDTGKMTAWEIILHIPLNLIWRYKTYAAWIIHCLIQVCFSQISIHDLVFFHPRTNYCHILIVIIKSLLS